jgi:hypothetical protein
MNQEQTKSKTNLMINILIFIGILAAIGFVIWGNIKESKSQKNFQIDVGSLNDVDSKSNFYIEESDSLNDRVKYGSTTYREVGEKSINLKFKPIGNITENSQAIIQLNVLNGDSDVYLNQELIFPGTKNYELIKEFEDSYLYKKKNLSNTQDFTNNSAIDFIIKNYYGASLYSFKLLDREYLNIQDYTKEETKINSTFRSNLRLAIYAENDIYLKFLKQDINAYSGEDKYILRITALNGTTVYDQILEDDGDILNDGLTFKPKEYNIAIENLKGVYYIDFKNFKLDAEADSTISNITLNTNKIVIEGDFLSLNPIKLYSNNQFQKNISFYYWREGTEQNIEVIQNGVNQTVKLQEEYKGKRYNYQINPGEIEINIPKGYVWLFNKFSFSLNKKNWFEVPIVIQDNLDDPDFLILDKRKIKVEKNGISLFSIINITNSDNTINVHSSGDNKIRLNNIILNIQ